MKLPMQFSFLLLESVELTGKQCPEGHPVHKLVVTNLGIYSKDTLYCYVCDKHNTNGV